MIELCYFSLDQWGIGIHLLWGICFKIPHWPKSHLTNGRLQHIKELLMLAACDPHLDQTKLNDLLPLTIDGVLVSFLSNPKSIVCLWYSLVQLFGNRYDNRTNEISIFFSTLTVSQCRGKTKYEVFQTKIIFPQRRRQSGSSKMINV